MGHHFLRSILLKEASGRHWKKIGVKRRAGLLFPLFSLRSSKNAGIGEFADLELLVDWCCRIGHSVIQLLPINDTARENSPYSAKSAFALNPLFLSISQMDGLKDRKGYESKIREMREHSEKEGRVPYRYIYEHKMELFREIYKTFWKSAGKAQKEEFSRYRKKNSFWLADYCLYRALGERFEERSWEQWPREYGERDSDALKKASRESGDTIRFYAYLQWQADKQMSRARQYAREKGVLLMGDIPFLVGRDSCDVWAHSRLFKLDISAGAPPDMFSDVGQKWGFPTFNWPVMESEGYLWYRKRLKQAEKFYDLYRIDHALGLYRIYSIEKEREDGSIGIFDPADEGVWEEHGEALIRMMLKASTMLPIAEDLGVVPDCVRPNLKKLGVPRTIVDRWERNYHSDHRFCDLEKVEPLAMNTLSTHDTETLFQWWDLGGEEKEKFFREALGQEGEPPRDMSGKIHHAILKRSYHSNCLFVINLPQDLLGTAPFRQEPGRHRINVPSTVNEENWSYLFPLSLEELNDCDDELMAKENERIRDLAKSSQRFNGGECGTPGGT